MNAEAITAFLKAQGEMGVALKKSDNPFFKSKYADLSAVQAAVFPAFHANGFAIYWSGGADDHGQFQDCVAHHTSGATFTSRCYLHHKAGDMQSLGGAITYARRYTLCSLTGVPVEDDDGNAATGRSSVKGGQTANESEVAAVDAAMSLSRAIPALTGDQMIKSGHKATKIINDLAKFDKEFADRISSEWQNRELELGISK